MKWPAPSGYRTSISGRLCVALIVILAGSATIVAGQGLIPGINVNVVRGTDPIDGDPYLQRQNEPALAVSSRNPCHLLAGSNDYRTVDIPDPTPLPNEGKDTTITMAPNAPDAWLGVYQSMDCGTTWRSTLLPGYPQDVSPEGLASPNKGYGAGADPVVRAGTNGMFYFAGLVFDRLNLARSQIFLARYIDNNNRERGDTIQYIDTTAISAATDGFFEDKPWLAVDIPRAAFGRPLTLHPRDDPRTDGGYCEVNGQRFPAGHIYVSWTRFKPEAGSRLMFARSRDCGRTWETQSIKGDTKRVFQGSSIAIAPHDGTVYIAYRVFPPKGSTEAPAIEIAVSSNGGRIFHRYPLAPAINAFDQVKVENRRFRTNVLPTVAADHQGRVYVAWAERGFAVANNRSDPTTGDARIVMAVSTDRGVTFKPRFAIDDTALDGDGLPRRGHQFMPSLTFTGGKLTAIWYDTSDDFASGSGPFIDDNDSQPDPKDPTILRRHTVDVRGGTADPADRPVFHPVLITPSGTTPRLSQYRTIVDPDGTVRQVQFNPPNLPLYVGGTTPFIGDYIDVAGENFAIIGDRWVPNVPGIAGQPLTSSTASSASAGALPPSPVFHALWTDHRDVKPPFDGDWTFYKAPNDPYWDANTCEPTRAGMRNANIYASRLTSGMFAGSPGNTKPLGFRTDPATGEAIVDPTTGRAEHLQRGFVVFVQNTVAVPTPKKYLLRIANQPGTLPGDRASFVRFPQPPFSDSDLAKAPYVWLVATVSPLSTISRTVFVTSANPKAQVRVDVLEVPAGTEDAISQDPAAAPAPLENGLRMSVLLNPDPTNPPIEDPDFVTTEVPVIAQEIHDPVVYDPIVTTIANVTRTIIEIRNPDEGNPDEGNKDEETPDEGNPDEGNPDEGNPDEGNPDEGNPDEGNPDEGNPDEGNPDEGNAGLRNLALSDEQLTNASIVDVQWKVENKGNTITAYKFAPAYAGPREGKAFQLLVTRRYYVPVVDGQTCEIAVRRTNQVMVNISGFEPRNPDEGNPDEGNPDEGNPDEGNPDEGNPDEGNPDEGNPDEGNPDEGNATFFLGPGETATVTMRRYDLTTRTPPPPPALKIIEKDTVAKIESLIANTGEAAPPSDSAGADLTVLDQIVAPVSVAPGGLLTVNWTLANPGTNPTTHATFKTRFLLSDDARPSAGDIELGFEHFTGVVLADNPETQGINEGRVPRVTVLGIPLGVVTAQKYVITQVDVDDTVLEADPDNNTSASQLGFTYHLEFIQQPPAVTEGFAFGAPVKVAALDAGGLPVVIEVPQVDLSIQSNPGGGTLLGTRRQANVAGVATFADLGVTEDGAGYSLRAVSVSALGAALAAPAISMPFTVEPDDPPIARADTYAVPVGGTLDTTDSPASRVVANDDDEIVDGPGVAPAGRALTATLVDGPEHGVLVLNPNGGFTYQPNALFSGIDRFTYRLHDGVHDGNIASVTIAVGDAGAVAANDRVTVAEDSGINAFAVLDNDLGDDPEVIGVTDAAHGEVAFTPAGVKYKPDPDYNGPDSFTYTINDSSGGAPSTASVFVTVTSINDDPDAVDDNVQATAGAINAFNVIANDTAAPDANEVLRPVAVGDSPNGTTSIAENGTILYTPDEGFLGADSFQYTVGDGNGGTDVAIVSVMVASDSQPPAAFDDSFVTHEDTPLAYNVVANDTDANPADILRVVAVAQGQHGSVQIGPGLTPALVVYTPNLHFNGEDTFQYTVSDGHGGTDVAVVTVTVRPVNDPPTSAAALPNQNALEGQANTVVDLTPYFTDPDIATNGDTLTFTVDQNSNPAVVAATVEGHTLTLDYGAVGDATVTIRATDSKDAFVTESLLVNVRLDNEAPVAVDDQPVTNEDTPIAIPVLANDSDADDDDLTIESATDAQHGTVEINSPIPGVITYTPHANYNGFDTFDYTISDGHGGVASATVMVAIDQSNDAPFVAEALEDRAANDADADELVDLTNVFDDVDISTNGDALNLSITSNSNPGAAAVTLEGAILRIDFLAPGTTTVTIRADDGFDEYVEDSFDITVSASNAPPVAVDDVVTAQAGEPITVNLAANDTDPDRPGVGASIVAEIPLNAPGLDVNNPGINVLAVAGTQYLYAAGVSGVSVIDTTINAVTAFIPTPHFASPTRAVADTNFHKIYFASSSTALPPFPNTKSIVAIDADPFSATFNQVLFALSLGGDRIDRLALDRARGRLYVLAVTVNQMGETTAALSSRVVVIDVGLGSATYGQQIGVVKMPANVTATSAAVNTVTGKVYVGATNTATGSPGVYVFPHDTLTLTQPYNGAPVHEVVVDQGRGVAFGLASNGRVLAVDLATDTFLSIFTVPGLVTSSGTLFPYPHMIASGGRLFVRSAGTSGATGFLFDIQPGVGGNPWGVLAQIEVGRDFTNDDMVLHAGTGRLMLGQSIDRTVTYVDTTNNSINATAAVLQFVGDLELAIVLGVPRVYVDGTTHVTRLNVVDIGPLEVVNVGAETGNVVVLPNEQLAFVPVNDTKAGIAAIDPNGNKVDVAGIESTGRWGVVGSRPLANQLYFVNVDTGRMHVRSSNPGENAAYDLGNGPTFGMAVNQSTGRVHVPLVGLGGAPGGVAVVDTVGQALSHVDIASLFTTSMGRNIAVVEALNKVYFQPGVVDPNGSNLGFYTEAGMVATRLPASLGATAVNILRVNQTTKLVYVGNQPSGESNRVLVIDADDDSLVATLKFGSPSTTIATRSYIAIDEIHGKVYIADFEDDTVHVVDAVTHQLLQTIHVGGGPTSIAINVAANRVYAGSTLDNRITFIDGDSMRVRGHVDLAFAPTFIEVDPAQSRVYASAGRSVSAGGVGLTVVHDTGAFFTHPLVVTSVDGFGENPDGTFTWNTPPDAEGPYVFAYTVSDGFDTDEGQLTVNVEPAFTITTPVAPGASVATEWDVDLTAENGVGALTWSVLHGTLPGGLVLSKAGRLYGVFTAGGTFTFTVRALDSSDPARTATREYSILVGPPIVPAAGQPNGLVNQEYGTTLKVGGMVEPVIWSLLTGSLPPGLVLDESGEIHGVPTVSGFFTFTVQVTDGTSTVTQTLSIFIDGPPVVADPPRQAVLHESYNNVQPFQGGRSPYTLELLNGALPSGLSITASGAITGTPQATGDFPVTFRVTDARGRTDTKAVNLEAVGQDQSIRLALLPSLGTTQAFDATRRLAQTLTVGADGELAAIRVSNVVCTSGSVLVELRRATSSGLGPDETGAPLATATGNGSSTVMPLTPRVSFTAGERIALVISTAGACEFRNVQDTQIYLFGSAYESVGGGAWERIDGATDLAVSTLIKPPTLKYFTEFGYSTHAAVTLANDDILITGNNQNASIYATATGSVRRTAGNMLSRRNAYTATRLDDGKVLIVGGTFFDSGLNQTVYLAASELYDNATETFAATGPLAIGRERHAAVKAPDGRVFIFGGVDALGNSLSSVEIYTPGTGSFGAGTPLSAARRDPTATLLECPEADPGCAYGGKILVVGTATNAPAELYDPISGVSMPLPGSLQGNHGHAHTATQLTDGRVLVVGGVPGPFEVEILDPQTWTSTDIDVDDSEMLSIDRHTATRLANGDVIIAAGRRQTAWELDFRVALFRFKPATNTIEGAGALKVFRAGHTATLLPDGRILFTGGFGPSNLNTRSFEYFDPAVAAPGFMLGARQGLPLGMDVTGFVIPVSGGTGPYTYEVIAGKLPTGIALAQDGTLSGAANEAGIFDFVVRVTDSLGQSTTTAFTLIVGGVEIATSVVGAEVGAPLNAQLEAEGGTPPYSWAITAGDTLPAGLSLDADGSITGTPQVTGSRSPRFRVEDANGQLAFRNIQIDVRQPLVLTTPTAAVLHESYNRSPYTGGAGPYTLSLLSGALPAGLAISPSGSISGTPQVTGAFPIELQVTDNQGRTETGAFTFHAGAVDQSIGSGVNPVVTQTFGNGRRLAQVFTAAADGALVAIRFHGTFTCAPAGQPVRAEVRRVTGGSPAAPREDGPPLAIATGLDGSGLTFAAPHPFFNAGEQFAIVLSRDTTCDLTQVRPEAASFPGTYLFGSPFESVGGGPWERIDDIVGLPMGTVIRPPSLKYLTSSLSTKFFATPIANDEVLVVARSRTSHIVEPDGDVRLTGQLSMSRSGPTVTKLDDGRVLVAGGVGAVAGPSTIQATAEVFSGNTYTTLASQMVKGRDQHTATKLVDGRVVLIGGNLSSWSPDQPQPVDIFNPATNTFSNGGNVLGMRSGHTATLLVCPAANPGCAWGGKILLVGGFRHNVTAPPVEIFDPATGTSVAAPSMNVDRFCCNHAAAALGDGRVLVAGGTTSANGAEVFDPATNAWTPVANSSGFALERLTLTELPDGDALLMGGRSFDQFDTDYRLGVYRFDAQTSSFAGAGRLTAFRTDHGVALLGDGRLLVAGGSGPSGGSLAGRSVEFLDLDAATSLAFTTVQLPAAQRGVAYPATPLQAAGGVSPYAFEILSGELPPGLGLNGNMIEGTPDNTARGLYKFTARVKDSSPVQLSATMPFSISVNGPVFDQTTLPGATLGQAYSFQLTATGDAPFAFVLTSGGVPAGMTFTNGLIEGTPVNPFNMTFRVRLQDASGQITFRWFTINVANPLTITTSSLRDLVATEWADLGLQTAGGGCCGTTWALDSGALPNGMRIENNSIRGNPWETGDFAFTVKATDGQGRTATRPLSLHVGAVDFQRYSFEGSGVATVSPNELLAQVVTVGGSGSLVGVRVDAACTAGNNAISVQIQGVDPDHGTPDGNILFSDDGSVQLFTALNAAKPRWEIVRLPGSRYLPVGSRIAVVLASATDCGIGLGTDHSSAAAFKLVGGAWTPVANAGADAELALDTVIDPASPLAFASWIGNENDPVHAICPEGQPGCTYPEHVLLSAGTEALQTFNVGTGKSKVTFDVFEHNVNERRAVRLNDGRILLSGGWHWNGTSSVPVAEAFLYDPQADSIAAVAPMNHARADHKAVLLGDGRVLVVGGLGAGTGNPPFPGLRSAEIFDPTTGPMGTWTLVAGQMVDSRWQHTVTRLDCPVAQPACAWGSKVLVYGGFTDTWPLAAGEILDVDTGQFAAVEAQENWTRANHAAAQLPNDGRVLIAGGQGSGFAGLLRSTLFYNPATGAVTPGPDMDLPRMGHTATTLASGDVLVAGGQIHQDGSETATLEKFLLGTNSFAGAGSMTVARSYHGAVRVADGRVVIAGGGNSRSELAVRSIEVVDLSESFSVVTMSLPIARVAEPYDAGIGLQGGDHPYTLDVLDGALPQGLAIQNNAGAFTIHGIPGQPGTFSFTVKATEGSQGKVAYAILSIEVRNSLFVEDTTPDAATAGTLYDYLLGTAGGNGNAATWEFVPGFGAMPPGINLAVDGHLTGTPTQGGSYSFVVRATDNGNPQQTITQRVRMSVAAVDQQQPTAQPTFEQVAGPGAGFRYAQIVVPGRTGRLARISMNVFCFADDGAFDVSIYDAAGVPPIPQGGFQGMRSTPSIDLQGAGNWYTFDPENPVYVRAGRPIAVVVDAIGGDCMVGAAGTDAYAPGQLYRAPVGAPSNWEAIAGDDLAFGLFVEPFNLMSFGTATIDGKHDAGEWHQASRMNISVWTPTGERVPATLFVQNDATNLYMSVAYERDAFEPFQASNVYFDGDNDGQAFEEGEDSVYFNSSPNGFPWFDDAHQSYEGCAPWTCWRNDQSAGGTRDGQSKDSYSGRHLIMEMSHPINGGDVRDLAAALGETIGFRFDFQIWNASGDQGFVTVPRWEDTAPWTLAPPPEQPIPAPPGLVGWWRAEGNAADAQGSHHGAIDGSVAFEAGKVGQAFAFGPGRVTVPHSDALNFGLGSFSIEGWVKAVPFSGYGTIVNKANEGFPAQRYALRINPDNKVEFLVTDCGTQDEPGCGWLDTRRPVISTSIVADNTYHHVAGVRRGDALEIYVDGVLEATRYEPARNADTPNALGIGAHSPLAGGAIVHDLEGSVDDVALYKRALSASEIAAIYRAGALGKSRTAQAQYTLQVIVEGHGKVTSADQKIACGGNCTHTYPAETLVNLLATPHAFGNVGFIEYQGDCGGGAEACQLAMNRDMTVIAKFTTNWGPWANSQSVTTDENEPVMIELTGGDPEGQEIGFEIVTPPSHGTLGNILGGDTVQYTPDAGFDGVDSFTFRTFDGFFYSGPATVSITVADAPACPAPCLAAAVNYPISGTPFQLAVGDVNNDSHLDIVTSSSSVLRGNGNGTFQPAIAAPGTGNGFDNDVLLADFVGDPNLDIVMPDGTGFVAFNTGLGNGSFGAQTYRHMGAASSFAVTTGHFNAGTDLDLAIVGQPDLMSVDWNTGRNPLQPEVHHFFDNPQSLAAGDLDGDGDDDIVVGNWGAVGFSLMRSTGVGGQPFEFLGHLPLLNGLNHVVVADLNGDAQLDLIGAADSPPGIAVSLNLGDFDFSPVSFFQGPAGACCFAYRVAVAEMTGDAHVDVLAAAIDGIWIFPGDGAGSFGAPLVVPSPAETWSLKLGDFNGDGRLDIAAGVDTGPTSHVSIFLKQPGLNNPPVANDEVVDINEDTPVDVTLTGSDPEQPQLSFSIVAQPSHGNLGPVLGNQVQYTPGPDFNGTDSFTFRAFDGIAYSVPATITILIAPVAEIAFTPVNPGPATLLAGQQSPVSVADFDGDGFEDLAFNTCTPDTFYRNISGEGFVDRTNAWRNGTPWTCSDAAVAPADYDNDGDVDLVRYSAASGVVLWHNQRVETGSTTFQFVQSFGTDLPKVVSWSDVDLDGDLDLFVASEQAQRLWRNDLEELAAGFSDVTAASGLTLLTGVDVAPSSAQWNDVDGDGDPELFLAFSGAAQNAILYWNRFKETGQILFEDVTAGAALGGINGTPAYGMFGDYDNDGDFDLTIGRGPGSANVYRNNDDTNTVAWANMPGHEGGTLGGARIWVDLDNDGDLDWVDAGSEGVRGAVYRNMLVDQGSVAPSEVVDLGPTTQTSVIPIDYDNDGDLDLYLGSTGASASRLLRNTTTGNNWLKIRLQGTTSNRSGVGARIMLLAGGWNQYRYVAPQSISAQHLSTLVHFGLGTASEVTLIEVTWPSGEVSLIGPVVPNQTLVITETAPVYISDPTAQKIIFVDSVTGAQSVVASGGLLQQPRGLAMDSAGILWVADRTGSVYRIESATGGQQLISSGNLVVSPVGLALESNGMIIVTDGNRVIRINPSQPSPANQTLVSSDGLLNGLGPVVVESTGMIVVANTGGNQDLVRINPATGEQVAVADSKTCANGLAVDADGSLIAAGSPGCGESGIHRLRPTGRNEITDGGNFVLPHGVAVQPNRGLLIVDPNASSGAGALVRVNKWTGEQTVITSGGNFVDPVDIAIRPPR